MSPGQAFDVLLDRCDSLHAERVGEQVIIVGELEVGITAAGHARTVEAALEELLEATAGWQGRTVELLDDDRALRIVRSTL